MTLDQYHRRNSWYAAASNWPEIHCSSTSGCHFDCRIYESLHLSWLWIEKLVIVMMSWHGWNKVHISSCIGIDHVLSSAQIVQSVSWLVCESCNVWIDCFGCACVSDSDAAHLTGRVVATLPVRCAASYWCTRTMFCLGSSRPTTCHCLTWRHVTYHRRT